MAEEDVIQGTSGTFATVASLQRDLKALGLGPGMTVLVHSSLSALGWVCGGAQAVVLALERTLSESGTLVMSTMTGITDPSQWRNPPVPESWWQAIRETMPAYEPALTPTRGMGVIPECFRRWPGVVRSNHPSFSFAALGPQARELMEPHGIDAGLGDASPLGRLYSADTHVLLLGVGHGNNTSLHLAEYRAEWPGKRNEPAAAPILREGKRVWAAYDDLHLCDDDFPTLGSRFDEESGVVQFGKVGQADAKRMPMRPLVDFATRWMEQHRT